jgi:hypothetical protein
MRTKTVFLNDIPIGQASTWTEVYALLKAKGVRFIGKPGAAEGPTAFYLHASLVKALTPQSKAEDGTG